MASVAVYLGLLSAPVAPVQAIDWIAHRGASYDAPENTLASVELAWQQQPGGVEVDVHLSRDQQIVVIHDADTKRVAGVERRVVDQTWSELSQLDVGQWKDPRWQGTRIPRLEEVIATLPPGKRLFIEIKCGPEIAEHLERVISSSGKPASQFVIISFKYDALLASQQKLPAIEHYLLAGYKQDPDTLEYPRLTSLIGLAREAGFAGLDLDHRWPIDKPFVSQVHAAGLKLYTYTVNDPATAQRLVDAGVDGITTDRPAWLAGQVR